MSNTSNGTTLGLPPDYHQYNSDYVSKDLERVKAMNKTEKALVSAKRFDSEIDTLFSAADARSRLSGLNRGLQVPTRFHGLTSGFPFPDVLLRAGVTHHEWVEFTHEVKRHARLSASQWMVTVAGSASIVVFGGLVLGWFSLIPATAVGHNMRRNREHGNFIRADQCGALAQCVNRWNQSCFKAKRLAVRVDIPGHGPDMEDMDLSTSKLFRLQQKNGTFSDTAGSTSHSYNTSGKELRYQMKEGHARVKAVRKGRIVIIPLDHKGKPLQTPSRLRTTAFPGLDGSREEEAFGVEGGQGRLAEGRSTSK